MWTHQRFSELSDFTDFPTFVISERDHAILITLLYGSLWK